MQKIKSATYFFYFQPHRTSPIDVCRSFLNKMFKQARVKGQDAIAKTIQIWKSIVDFLHLRVSPETTIKGMFKQELIYLMIKNKNKDYNMEIFAEFHANLWGEPPHPGHIRSLQKFKMVVRTVSFRIFCAYSWIPVPFFGVSPQYLCWPKVMTLHLSYICAAQPVSVNTSRLLDFFSFRCFLDFFCFFSLCLRFLSLFSDFFADVSDSPPLSSPSFLSTLAFTATFPGSTTSCKAETGYSHQTVQVHPTVNPSHTGGEKEHRRSFLMQSAYLSVENGESMEARLVMGKTPI